MMTSAAEKLVVEKKEEKVEKRRALGRGLASLLPGPRVVKSTEYPGASSEPTAPTAGAVAFPAPAGGAHAEDRDGGGEQQVPRFARNDKDLVRSDKDKDVARNERELPSNDSSGE